MSVDRAAGSGPRGSVLVAAIVVFLLAGCESGWRTDMWYQQAHRPEQSPRPEPATSAPLGSEPSLPSRDEADSLRNPSEGDTVSIRHGLALFAPHCSACHGDQGHGGGPVSKFFPPAPDLAEAAVKARSDGYIFGTITFGGRAMPSQVEGLDIRDRWDLVNAVRSIQGKGPQPGAHP